MTVSTIKSDRLNNPEEIHLKESPKEPEKRKAQYAYVMALLLDSFENSTELSAVTTKILRENADYQQTLANKMDSFALQDLPKDAYENVAIYKTYRDFDDITMSYGPEYKVLDHYEHQLTHPEKLRPVQLFNQEQIQLRQNLQGSESVLKAGGDLNVASTQASLKQAGETSGIRKEILSTLSGTVRTISQKMRGE